MFRRKDNEPARPGPTEVKSDAGVARPALDPAAKSPMQPELPRRKVEIPAGPAAAAATPAPAASVMDAVSPRVDGENPQGKRLIVGKGIRLSGEITACDRLIVEGFVEVRLNETRAVEIAESGRFIGGCEVEEAEISGTYEGELTVRHRLLIHSSGRVEGTIRYGDLEIERGGRLTGNVSMLSGDEPAPRRGPSAARRDGGETAGGRGGDGPSFGDPNPLG